MGSIVNGDARGDKVSVVIPLFNGGKTIARTLRCAVNQTYRNIEVIVVDDGSDDSGPQIVRDAALQDSRIKLVTQKNAGVAAARNRGVEEASGAFIAPLDADDLWAKRKIELQLSAFRAGGAEVGLVYSWFVVIDSSDRILWHGHRSRHEGRLLPQLLREDFIGSGSNAMMRADLVKQVNGYDAGLRLQKAEGAEDWLIALQIAELSTVKVVPEPLVGYRRTRGNMSSRARQMLDSAKIVAGRYATKYPELTPVLQSHIEDRRKWLFARSVSELNLGEMRALYASMPKGWPGLGSLAGALLPVFSDLTTTALRGAKFKSAKYFNVDDI